MAKKSKRITVRYEKDQSGCMWGFISLFDFRHGRSSRKLLVDKKRSSRQTLGSGNSRNKFEILANLDEDCSVTLDSEERKTLDVGKPSVKRLIEEEMFNELDVKRIECEHSGHLKTTDPKKAKKSRPKSHDIDADSFNAAEYLKEKSLNNLPVDVMLKEIYSQIHLKSTSEKFDTDDKAEMQSNGYLADLEQKVVDAIKEYLGQKFNIGKDFTEIQKVQHSREIMDALQIPHSDDELFLELAQNPNSVLLKYIRNLHDVSIERVEEPKSHEFGEVRKSEELVDHKQRLFFRRKVKHRGRNASKGNESSDASSKIVILKPGPKGLVNSEADNTHPSAQNSTAIDKRKVLNERVSSNFFLAEIKRKFKYAMGKDHHELSTNTANESEKGDIKENAARNSISKDRFFIERIARPSTDGKRGEKVGKLKNLEINQDLENIYNNRRSPSNIYVEAKKHLSEMISSGDESVDFFRGHVPKTLGRILSLPEYSFSPINSPKRDSKLSPLTPEKKISAGSRLLNVNEIMPSSKGENSDTPISPGKSPLCISDDTPNTVQPPVDDNYKVNRDVVDQSIREEAVSSSTIGMTSEGDIEILKVNEIAVHEERSILDAPSGSSESSLLREDQNGEMPDARDDRLVSDVPSDPIASSPVREDHSDDMPDVGGDEPSISLPQDLAEENQLPPSPSASHSSSSTPEKAVGDLKGVSDVPERPSPVSVLDTLFVDDAMSPVHAMSLPAELPVQAVHIEFEDCEPADTDKANVPKSLKEDKEVIFDYVKAVLLASGLTWNQICGKWLSSEQILDLLLIDEVELFPNQLCSDQKLLFDCINDEVLTDFCQSYPPWFSFVQPCLRTDYLIEICEGVYWHLLPLPQPLTLDHLVGKDMSRTRTWMNLHSDAETIGTETCDAIFEDLVHDTILSCVFDDSSESDDEFCTENENVSDDL